METILDFRMVSIDKIKGCGFNPKSRLGKNKLTELAENIKAHGVLSPVWVIDNKDGTFTLGDGHRRTNSARMAGLKEIPVRVLHEVTIEEAYKSASTHVRKATGNENLSVFALRPDAVSTKTYQKLQKMSGVIGKELLDKLVEMGGSFTTYSLVTKVIRYCLLDEVSANYKAILQWVLDTKSTDRVRSAMEMKASPVIIMDAVAKNKGLTFGVEA